MNARLPKGNTLRLRSDGGDDTTREIFWHGWTGHEPETASLFWTLAAASRVTVDVGADIGYFSNLAALANRNGRVYAFEPRPSTFARLESNVALNGLTNVSCHQLAVGREAGTVALLNVSDDTPSSSRLSRRFVTFLSPAPLNDNVSSEVRMTTLDDFAASHNLTDVDLVKISTHPAQDGVLSGMVSILSHQRPRVVCEVGPTGHEEEIEDVLRSLDYCYQLITDKGIEPQTHVVAHPRWRNYLFDPAERRRGRRRRRGRTKASDPEVHSGSPQNASESLANS